jgi:hypothetical protein
LERPSHLQNDDNVRLLEEKIKSRYNNNSLEHNDNARWSMKDDPRYINLDDVGKNYLDLYKENKFQEALRNQNMRQKITALVVSELKDKIR